jgi:hypothetical protein
VILFPLCINPKTNFADFKSCVPFTHESARRKEIINIKIEYGFVLFVAGHERRGHA